MRILHLADLHLGRSLAEVPLTDLQREFLDFVIQTVHERQIDAVLLAGDVYDRSMPSVRAVQLLNDFLSRLAAMRIPVLLVAGNHDSAERLSFLSGILELEGLYIAGEYRLGAQPVTLTDEFGPVHFHLLPFFRPGAIRFQAQDESIETYDDAVRAAVERMPLDPSARNVLITHHFVCAAGQEPLRSDSETSFIGGIEQVNAACFEPFDYVALGHLHRPQRVGRDTVRYAGSPIPYSLSEADSSKSLVIAELGREGEVSIELVPIRLSQTLRSIKGAFEELKSRPADDADGDLLAVVLTDENPVYDARERLSTRYPHIIFFRYQRDMALSAPGVLSAVAVRETDPLSLFEKFYEEIRGTPLSAEAKSDIRQAIKEAQEEENS